MLTTIMHARIPMLTSIKTMRPPGFILLVSLVSQKEAVTANEVLINVCGNVHVF